MATRGLVIALPEHHVDYMNRKGWSFRYYTGGTFSPKCTSDGLDSCMAPAFWQTLISIAEVRKRYCLRIDPYKSKPISRNSSCSAWQPGIANGVETTETLSLIMGRFI